MDLVQTIDWHLGQIMELVSASPDALFNTELVDEFHPGYLAYPLIQTFRHKVIHQNYDHLSKADIYRQLGNQAFLELTRDKAKLIMELRLIRDALVTESETFRFILPNMLSETAFAHGQLTMLLKESP